MNDGIDGVHHVELSPHPDSRGSLTELYRRSWFPEAPPMLQANLSQSEATVLRGVHYHRRQGDYWVVLGGVACVGLYDLREGSPTRGRGTTVWMDQMVEGAQGLYIPPGVAHGFAAVEELTLLYLVDAEFTGEDEHGVAWDDPGLGIDWPLTDPILSDRDRSNPALSLVLRDPPPYRPDMG
jgi:dTDP-4-dehydrorhamnose 3,5-epimerase